jgi:hypothetical protein
MYHTKDRLLALLDNFKEVLRYQRVMSTLAYSVPAIVAKKIILKI